MASPAIDANSKNIGLSKTANNFFPSTKQPGLAAVASSSGEPTYRWSKDFSQMPNSSRNATNDSLIFQRKNN